MKIRKELLQAFLDKYGITAAILAREMHADESDIQTLLNGGAEIHLLFRRGRGCKNDRLGGTW